MFGWPADFMPDISEEQRAAAERAETRTGPTPTIARFRSNPASGVRGEPTP